MSNAELLTHLKAMIARGGQVLATARHNQELDATTGKINSKGNETLAIDIAVEKKLIEYAQAQTLPVVIYSEEAGIVNFHPDPLYTLVMDPLDGSNNHLQGQDLLPYGIFLAMYQTLSPDIDDVLVAAALEHTRQLSFYFDGEKTVDGHGQTVKLRTDWKVDRKTPVYLETFDSGYGQFLALARTIFIHNQGALVGSLGYVLKDAAAAMGGIAVKSEEVGAIVALIEGAGGKVVDLQGNSLRDQPLDHTRKYELIGGAPVIVDHIVKVLNGYS
ncbi:MAG TPA: inositol monophosphatase family protein [Vitreimonas sp.]|nr:inositol monophosphatase family protein [Vitreimonas sp.]